MSEEFVVNDRRLFTKDGQVNPEAEAGDNIENTGAASSEPPSRASEQDPKAESFGQNPPPPPANFAGLLVGLATSAFMHLGEGPEGSERARPDLLAAKHAIDLLAVLQDKTRGNLEAEEEALLTTLLYDLRLKFVQASR